MEIVVPMLIVLVIGAIAIPVILLRNRRDPPTGGRDAIHRGSMPTWGSGSPTKDGEPMPGSQADRGRHGKP